MSVQVEKLEHNMAKLTIEVEAAEFDAATKRAYNKKKSSFNLPGFRKGKVPMNVIEKTYGAGVFYEDAANDIMPKAYADALDETGIDVVSRPEIDVTKIGKGESFIFTATVAIKPEVTLGQYKGLEVQKESVEVTDEEVEAELKKAGYRYLCCTAHPKNRYSENNILAQGYRIITTREKYGGFLRDIFLKEL